MLDLQVFPGERLKGLEPSTFCMASRRSSQLSYSRRSAEYSPPATIRPHGRSRSDPPRADGRDRSAQRARDPPRRPVSDRARAGRPRPGLIPGLPKVALDPDLVLVLFLPPLMYIVGVLRLAARPHGRPAPDLDAGRRAGDRHDARGRRRRARADRPDAVGRGVRAGRDRGADRRARRRRDRLATERAAARHDGARGRE